MAQLIQSGTFQLFNHFEDDGFMWRGEGQRNVAEPVVFEKKFNIEPHVLVTPTLMDCNTSAFMRYELVAGNISKQGFVAYFHTWADSQFARVNISWVAIEPSAAREDEADFWEGV